MMVREPHSFNLRRGRFSKIGLYYFLTSTVAGRRNILTDDDCARIVFDSLGWLHFTNRFCIDAAVVMPDHIHFVGNLRAGNLASIMHSLKSFTSKQLLRKGIEAPVWQSGYYDHALRADDDYAVRVRYLLENPLRAGLSTRVKDYPFLLMPLWWRE